MATDTERLDWLEQFADKGVIRLDYDLDGCPVIFWSVFDEANGFMNPRDAIDAAMREAAERTERTRRLND